MIGNVSYVRTCFAWHCWSNMCGHTMLAGCRACHPNCARKSSYRVSGVRCARMTAGRTAYMYVTSGHIYGHGHTYADVSDGRRCDCFCLFRCRCASVCIDARACVWRCVHANTYIHTYIHTCRHIYTYVCMYVCMHVCMYVCRCV